MSVIQDFLIAALPWIAIAVAIAYITAGWSNKKDQA